MKLGLFSLSMIYVFTSSYHKYSNNLTPFRACPQIWTNVLDYLWKCLVISGRAANSPIYPLYISVNMEINYVIDEPIIKWT